MRAKHSGKMICNNGGNAIQWNCIKNFKNELYTIEKKGNCVMFVSHLNYKVLSYSANNIC